MGPVKPGTPYSSPLLRTVQADHHALTRSQAPKYHVLHEGWYLVPEKNQIEAIPNTAPGAKIHGKPRLFRINQIRRRGEPPPPWFMKPQIPYPPNRNIQRPLGWATPRLGATKTKEKHYKMKYHGPFGPDWTLHELTPDQTLWPEAMIQATKLAPPLEGHWQVECPKARQLFWWHNVVCEVRGRPSEA
jgi:hypothetical protein